MITDSLYISNPDSLPQQLSMLLYLKVKQLNDMYRKCQFRINISIHMYRKSRFLGHILGSVSKVGVKEC